MEICSATSYPFGFPSRRKLPPLDIIKFLVTTLSNQDNKIAFIRFDEDGELTRSSEFMKTFHNINIIVQTTGGDASYLNGKSESPNKTLDNITRYLLLNSSHNKELWYFSYQYAIRISCQNETIFRGDVTYFLWYGNIPSLKHIKIWGVGVYIINGRAARKMIHDRPQRGYFMVCADTKGVII